MRELFFLRYTGWSAAASIISGFLHALPFRNGIPSQAALVSAARGLAAMKKLAGYNPASLADLWMAWLWKVGGASLLVWSEWLSAFLCWTLATFLALVVLSIVLRFFCKPRARGVLFAAAALLALAVCLPGAWSTWNKRTDRLSNIKLLAPVELIDAVRALEPAELFATVNAQANLLLFAPSLAGGLAPDQAALLSRNPEEWRKILRTKKWQAALLTGPLTEFRPLLDHFNSSPDWHLSAITNQGYLFLRGSGPSAKSLEAGSFQLSTERETAVYLAQIAERYDAVGRVTEARACLDRAEKLAPDNPSVLAYAATFAAAHKRWQDAITYSKKALALEPDFAQAKIIQALALIELKEPGRAWELVRQVLDRNPEDLSTLFLFARVCKLLNDNSREAETLEKIIAINARSGLPVLHYRIYLGQAYSRMGQAKEALENYRAVLADGQLNKEQAEEIQDAIATIESRKTP